MSRIRKDCGFFVLFIPLRNKGLCHLLQKIMKKACNIPRNCGKYNHQAGQAAQQ